MNIPSILRHWFTLAATAATAWLIATVALDPEQQKELAKAFGDLVGPLVIIGTLVITALWRVALAWLTKVFRTGSGESGGGPGGLPLWMLISTAAVIGGSLPSCANMPLRATIFTDDGAVSYSSKGGLEISATVTDRRYSRRSYK
jgi:hypothetical protein